MGWLARWLNGASFHSPFLARVFHTSIWCLNRELHGCNSVLDLGCGPNSQVRRCGIRTSVGVEAFPAYVIAAAQKGTHSQLIRANVTEIEFAEKTFDAVVMIQVLEHLSREDGAALLGKATLWARKCVIITTPNGPLPQHAIDKNPYQIHRSGWDVRTLRSLGFQVFGMAGAKVLRSENRVSSVNDADAVYGTVRWRPKWLWLIVSELTQLLCYHAPNTSFQLFCVRRLENPFVHHFPIGSCD